MASQTRRPCSSARHNPRGGALTPAASHRPAAASRRPAAAPGAEAAAARSLLPCLLHHCGAGGPPVAQPMRLWCCSLLAVGRLCCAHPSAPPLLHTRECRTVPVTNRCIMKQPNRRELWAINGWNIADDDLPNIPEPDPMSSAQSRRAWRHTAHAGPDGSSQHLHATEHASRC